MNIAIYSLKGGVSKSSIACNIAIEKKMDLIDNDPFGGVTELINKHRRKNTAYTVKDNEKIPLSHNTVYDLGGFRDPRTKDILEAVDLVIVPTLHSYSDVKTTVTTIHTLNQLKQKNILVIINKVQTNRKKYDDVTKEKQYVDFIETRNNIINACSANDIKLKNVYFLSVRQNKIWTKSTSNGKSIFQLAEKSDLVKHSSKAAIEDLQNILDFIKGKK